MKLKLKLFLCFWAIANCLGELWLGSIARHKSARLIWMGVCQFCRLAGIACASRSKQPNWRSLSVAHATCGNNSGNLPHPTCVPSRAAAIDRQLCSRQLTAMWQALRLRRLELLRWPWVIMSINALPSASRVHLRLSTRPAAIRLNHRRCCRGINRWLCRQ